jgi:phenylpropionate dioxygenase-like ring-hydroxylating dioxygenase large terminal subunit
MRAPLVKAHVSVSNMRHYWYVACLSKELKTKKPLKVTMLGIPMVIFRNESGEVGALLDRCPHRSIPLSIGTVRGDCIECPYHGWQFKPDGTCAKVPGLKNGVNHAGREAAAYPAREQQGFVWVFTSRDVEPHSDPYHLPYLDEKGYTTGIRRADAEGSLHATIENALDVPHTSFLHKGLFRGKERNDIVAKVRRWPDHCEAEYIGEPRPKGLAGRILAPGGGEVVHFDRFFLPSIAQVDYRLHADSHVFVNTLCTPVSDFHTILFAVISFRLRWIPGWLGKLVLEPLGRKIFSQDQKILKLQTETIQQFGGEQYVSTEIDLLGPHIWRLMKTAEGGVPEPTEEPVFEKSIEMNV